MTFSAFDQIKEQIMQDVLYILDNIRKDRSFLNKHFQNSINNYFLEDYAGQFLKEYLNTPRAKDITKYIQNKYMDLKGTKYMKLMYGYIQELKEANQINQFMSCLLENIQYESNDFDKTSKEWQSNVWKRAFSLFVHHFCLKEYDQLKGIFEIWNSLFPSSAIKRKRQENVNHRPREYQELEIDNVRIAKNKNQNQNSQQMTSAEQQAIQNLNQNFFGNEFKSGMFFPNQKYNEYHLKQQCDYYVAPQQQQQQQQQQFQSNIQYNSFYSNQNQQKQIDNQIFSDQAEIEWDNQFQKLENMNDFLTNVPEDMVQKSEDMSSPISSAPQTMNNFNENQYDQVIELQQQQSYQQQQNQFLSLSRNNSYKFIQQINYNNNQISQQIGDNQFNLFQNNEESYQQNNQYVFNFNSQENQYVDYTWNNYNNFQQNYA